MKPDLYDAVVVNGGNVRIQNDVVREKCAVTPADRRRFEEFLEAVLHGSRYMILFFQRLLLR